MKAGGLLTTSAAENGPNIARPFSFLLFSHRNVFTAVCRPSVLGAASFVCPGSPAPLSQFRFCVGLLIVKQRMDGHVDFSQSEVARTLLSQHNTISLWARLSINSTRALDGWLIAAFLSLYKPACEPLGTRPQHVDPCTCRLLYKRHTQILLHTHIQSAVPFCRKAQGAMSRTW